MKKFPVILFLFVSCSVGPSALERAESSMNEYQILQQAIHNKFQIFPDNESGSILWQGTNEDLQRLLNDSTELSALQTLVSNKLLKENYPTITVHKDGRITFTIEQDSTSHSMIFYDSDDWGIGITDEGYDQRIMENWWYSVRHDPILGHKITKDYASGYVCYDDIY